MTVAPNVFSPRDPLFALSSLPFAAMALLMPPDTGQPSRPETAPVEDSPKVNAKTATNQQVRSPEGVLQLSQTVVPRRSGAVLARGYILKTDHYATGRALDLEYHLQGAPNFRPAAGTSLDIYGVAQPKLSGIRTILACLQCSGKSQNPRRATWISTREEPMIYIGGRPYVLRDSEQPFESISLTDHAARLEEIETRLKQDIIHESLKHNGMILVHEELSDGRIVGNWFAADEVRTAKELFQAVSTEGYHVQYHRLPIGASQDPESHYLDAYLDLMRDLPTDECLIFNCGMGITRSSYAMSAALIVRRKRMMAEGSDDPLMTLDKQRRLLSTAPNSSAAQSLQAAIQQQAESRCTLQLMDILHRNLKLKNANANLTETLTAQPSLLQSMRNAVFGRYDLILRLLACLDDGPSNKELVDHVIDQCGSVVNIRHTILEQRIHLANTSSSAEDQANTRRRALKSLERYFFLIAFAAYMEDHDINTKQRFFDWIRSRDEISGMVRNLRTAKTLGLFSPIEDLSSLTQVDASRRKGHTKQWSLVGSVPAGEDIAEIIVARRQGLALRPGTILKRDLWRQYTPAHASDVRGALNFRHVPNSNVYALAQPTEDGIKGVLGELSNDAYWINLREEPLLYINNKPYVLRSTAMSLRNTQDFAGISSSRLEMLENRLKADVQAEIKHFDGRLLLHQENSDGTVQPVWEDTRPSDVRTLRECMQDHHSAGGLTYYRLPITAEKPPDFHDLAELLAIVRRADAHDVATSIVVNCQLGQGRSTLATILILMTQHWLSTSHERHFLKQGHARPYSFQIVNNLLRVVKNGSEIKSTVDYFIGQCSEQLDLLDYILSCRREADQATPELRTGIVAKGLLGLKRYWRLLLLAIYFNENSASSDLTFGKFVASRPVFATLQAEFENAGVNALRPLGLQEKDDKHESETQQFIAARSGRVLTSSTILKSDFFSGLQKKLPENVAGSPNFRRVAIKTPESCARVEIYGTGMPSSDGLRNALVGMDAHPDGKRTVFFQSLREEPVIYVASHPHVLRLTDSPFENVVTTGVTASRVIQIEDALKADVLTELKAANGQVLLHDETLDESGQFNLSADWVAASEDDVKTVAEVFSSAKQDKYKVDFMRLPVTDEQSPLPLIFAALEERVVRSLSQHGSGEQLGFAFNCQMGRGRTTSAMVICALTIQILFEGEVETPTPEPRSRASSNGQTWDDSHENIYLAGEYRLILQLMSVLADGRRAKKVTDRAIDAMSAIQNLREAVYSYKLRSEAAEDKSPSQEKIVSVGLNYLSRYGMLISFSDYLFSRRKEAAQLSTNYESSFPEFLKRRTEITTILAKRTFA